MGQPAARITDMHTCPMFNGPVPHIGGPVNTGAPTVLIGGLPAARVGDMATCVGPPDVIVKGSASVLICGMPAARMGDSTAHGGVIVGGCPTVLIGDAAGAGVSSDSLTVDSYGLGLVLAVAAGAVGIYFLMNSDSKTETYAQGIQVKGSSQFRKDTKAALDRVNATPTGKLVIDDVVRSGKTVTIVETTDPNGFSKDFTEDANRKPDGTAGKGSSSTIAFNPSFKPDGLPNELILGHELIHAQNKAYGVRETGITGGTKDEELKTVGLPPYPESGMTENSLRKDLGLTKRTSY